MNARLIGHRCRVPAKAGVRDFEARANYWRCPQCGATEDSVFAEREAGEYLRVTRGTPPQFVYAGLPFSPRLMGMAVEWSGKWQRARNPD